MRKIANKIYKAWDNFVATETTLAYIVCGIALVSVMIAIINKMPIS